MQYLTHCWPVLDAGQKREFRRLCVQFLKDTEAIGAIPRGYARMSLLNTARGDRYVGGLGDFAFRGV